MSRQNQSALVPWGSPASVCQGRAFVAFGGILEREVSGRRISTVFEQSAARKFKKREHRYLWAEVNKSAHLGNLQCWQIPLITQVETS